MKHLFIIIRNGVYRHGIVGIYETLDEAKNAAEVAIRKEDDDYHTMLVVRSILGTSDIPDCEQEVCELTRRDRIRHISEGRGKGPLGLSWKDV